METRHFVQMKRIPGQLPVEVKTGEIIEVVTEGPDGQRMVVPMTVLAIYDNGDFDGEVVYAEA